MFQKVVIVGVGLIGGSIGLALRERNLAAQVVGLGRNQQSLDRALSCQAVTSITLDPAEAAHEAEVIVVCTPVETVVDQVLSLSRLCGPETLLTDAGSTKETIVDQIEAQLPANRRFIGSHPLAGSEQAGVEFARSDLLQDRLVILTPTARTQAADLQLAQRLWQALGARTEQIDPKAHDQALAATSHVPHVVASALAGSTDRSLLRLTAGGWRDATRIAAGDPELWQQIMLDNQSNVLAQLDRFEQQLQQFRNAITNRDAAVLKELLVEAKVTRDALGS